MLSLIKLFKRPGTKYILIKFSKDNNRLYSVESCVAFIRDRRKRSRVVTTFERGFSREFPRSRNIKNMQHGIPDDFIYKEFASIEMSIR